MAQLDRLQVVVLSHDRIDTLPRLLDELLAPAASCGAHVTIVDNASGSPVREFLAGLNGVEQIDVVFNEANLGVAKGRNAAFRRSDREFIVYLDDDALITLEDLERVPAVFDASPDAGILAFRVVHGDTAMPQNELGGSLEPVGNFHGAGHAIRCSVFERIGYLDEECFFGAEEIEFAMRALRAGVKTVSVPEIVVRHFSFERAGPDAAARRVRWARNYAMVLFRYLPFRTASLFSARLLVSYLAAAFGSAPVNTAVQLPFAMTRGALSGWRTRTPLGSQAVAFYVDPQTRPELGNVSLRSKLRKHFRANG